MFGMSEKREQRKFSAYTLAEMLLVMAIIMMVILSLPAATKKVFRVEETRKSHGRYECYWDNGKLMEYMAEENGRQVTQESKAAEHGKCVFQPPLNPIYFMVHAVGGGGAGARIEDAKTELEPAEQVESVSYLYKSSPDLFPDWIKFINSKTCDQIPWASTTCTSLNKVLKDSFDVNKIAQHQLLRYRLSGSAAKVVSMFVPSIPPNVSLEIIPGKGGILSSTETVADGGDGQDTIVRFVYHKDGSADKTYDALLARGGEGGNGEIDGRISVMMLGGAPGDFGLTNYASIKEKDAGFSDIIESAEQLDALKTRIKYSAGSGGNGETQYAANTGGYVLYEYDRDRTLVNSRRKGTEWINVTDKLGLNFYKSDSSVCYNNGCTETNLSEIEITREGYCTPVNAVDFKCTLGKNNNDNDLNGCQGQDTTKCSAFKVTYNPVTKTSVIKLIKGSGSSETLADNPTEYTPQTKFYNCTFDYSTFRMTCNTKLLDVKVHKANTPSGTFKCANGRDPVGEGLNAKCSASVGGDGAVVILW